MPRHSLIYDEPKETKNVKGKLVHVLVKGALTKTGRAHFEGKRSRLADLTRLDRDQVSEADTIEWLARDQKIPENVLRARLAPQPKKKPRRTAMKKSSGKSGMKGSGKKKC